MSSSDTLLGTDPVTGATPLYGALLQEQLAEAAGMSKNHVQLLESGLSDRKKQSPANPTFGTLVALSRALGVDLPELLRGVVPRAD
jgi:transcriptional regulator with XRE-family HTH domain